MNESRWAVIEAWGHPNRIKPKVWLFATNVEAHEFAEARREPVPAGMVALHTFEVVEVEK